MRFARGKKKAEVTKKQTDRQTEGLDAFRFFGGGVYEVVKKRAGYSLLTCNVGFAYEKKKKKTEPV